MSCPSNGDDGRGTGSRTSRVRPRFYPTGSSPTYDSASHAGDRVLIEEESSDVSEQQFAASLLPQRRFVPGSPAGRANSSAGEQGEPGSAEKTVARASEPADPSEQNTAQPTTEVSSFNAEPAAVCADTMVGPACSTAGLGEDSPADGAQWRQEVAARLNHYHSRRSRKPPRYPSLALKFDPPVYSSSPSRAAEAHDPAAEPVPSRSEVATAAAATAPEEPEEAYLAAPDASNVIEFPRPLLPPPPRPDELAEPMLELPRILDAPEAVPKQVPLGGIILQSEEATAPSELELPLQVAPLSRRVMAAGLDGVLVLAATLMFALVANKVAALLPSARVLLSLGVALPAILWAVFQYVFLVYTGSTPGMRLIGLRLYDFDGSVPGRSTRRWRALAMALSAVSLGLGFLWCLLDEDTLCWHDRITRTYLDAGRSTDSGARPGPFFPQRVIAGLRQMDAFLRRRDQETSDQPPGPPAS
jgi:uncharacterized RDD family membrane protein YckC